MVMIPKVSIIIPFYNCAYVDQAIESALNQSYPSIEVIVVNDGSTMHLEKLEPYADRITILHKVNGGTATALNWGMDTACGTYTAWLSSDDLFLPEKISLQVEYMERNRIDLCFSDYLLITDAGTEWMWSVNESFEEIKGLKDVLSYRNPINGSTMLMKRTIFREAGFFEPKYRFTHDYDMWMRLMLKGYSFGYIHRPLIKYRTHPASGSMNHQADIRREMNDLQLLYREKRREED
ncbi:glycosyltransferase [Rossellomorea marisflavi]|uniref:glycosyltransferase family 2 protein n=1 Tax=Rossellomorea marisflavi TaxID=189381 RepID=UPI003D299F61